MAGPVEMYDIGFHIWRGRAGVMRRSHAHTELEINFIVRGHVRYFLGGAFETIEAGRLALFWAGIPHTLVETPPGTEMFWLTLPTAWMLGWNLDARFVARLFAGQLLQEPSDVLATLDTALLQRWIDDLAAADAPARRPIVMLELEARLRRFALSTPLRPARGRGPGDAAGQDAAEPVWRMARYVAEHFRDDDISVDAIAGSADLHPNYAMQRFKRACGMSLWEFVTRLRISHAQRLLLTGDWKVHRIAADCGFGAASRFYDAFSRICGMTPRQYRASASRGGAGAIAGIG